MSKVIDLELDLPPSVEEMVDRTKQIKYSCENGIQTRRDK